MGTHNMFSWSNKKGISFFRMMIKKKKKKKKKNGDTTSYQELCEVMYQIVFSVMGS